MRVCVVAILLLFLTSCQRSGLMEESALLNLASRETTEHLILFFAQECVQATDGTVRVTTRRVLQAGDDLKSFPGLLSVLDSPTEPLDRYEARLLHTDGTSKHYGRSDLSWASLNNSRRVSTTSAYYLPIDGQIRPGDIVESVSEHRLLLPQLGMAFHPAESGVSTRAAKCVIDLPEGEVLRYRVMNDTLLPAESMTNGRHRYEFLWSDLEGIGSPRPFMKRNGDPALLVSLPAAAIANWTDFGDWYLRTAADRLEITPALQAKALELTAGVQEPGRKMEIIANYCQQRVRYEQVYLERGEILPNPVGLTHERAFGDCKDYSALMVTLAKAAGLSPSLALCFRGRGVELQETLPVPQFNHMVICLEQGDSVTWYDGTNRMPFAGVVSYDVVHSPALVLRSGGSYCTRIPEDRGNRLDIRGTLRLEGTGLAGTLTVNLTRQYAIDLLYAAQTFREVDFRQYAMDWMRRHVSSVIRLQSMASRTEESGMVLTVSCEIPNCVLSLPPDYHTSVARVFDMLLPVLDEETETAEVYYYPHYGRVDLRVDLPDLREADGTHAPATSLALAYDIPIGPLSARDRTLFSARYDEARRTYARTIHYFRSNK